MIRNDNIQLRRSSAVWRVFGVLLILACVAIAGAVLWRARHKTESQSEPTFRVERGPLTISVTQSGTIRAIKQEIITSEVEGQTTIIYLIEEGTRVSKGDLLVQLDDSALKDRLVEQQIKVENAEAAYIRARETLEVTKIQAESDTFTAELNYRFAQEDLKEYEEGAYKQELREAESRITLAEEELQLAARKLEWSGKLFQEKYISQSERDADALAYKRAQMNVELARAAKNLLENFTHQRKLDKLQSAIPQSRRALEIAKLRARANIVQAEADLKAKEMEWRQQKEKEAKILDQIAKTKIVAPRDGLVVYATSARPPWWRGGSEPLDVGQTVRERQELIYLPTADRMLAEIQVHESNLDKIRVGQSAIMTVDALQGRVFTGKVTRIAPLPDAASVWMNPDLKVYRTVVEIEGDQPDLRVGMSCMVEIIVDRYEDALYIPLQAIVRVNGKPTVYVRKGKRFEPVPVTIGLDNNRMVHVLSGLEAGQEVLLAPPLQVAAVGGEKTSGNGAISTEAMRVMVEQSRRAAHTNGVERSGEEESPVSGGPGSDRREEIRRRLESMTPEERERLRREWRARRGGTEGPPVQR
ncbi:MAG: efflux RND transporter periplasmic adaptor subunit [Kiritimatiellia bacterium]